MTKRAEELENELNSRQGSIDIAEFKFKEKLDLINEEIKGKNRIIEDLIKYKKDFKEQWDNEIKREQQAKAGDCTRAIEEELYSGKVEDPFEDKDEKSEVKNSFALDNCDFRDVGNTFHIHAAEAIKEISEGLTENVKAFNKLTEVLLQTEVKIEPALVMGNMPDSVLRAGADKIKKNCT